MTDRALQPGTRLELELDGCGTGGEGVGRAAGRAVFVPRAAPGERVRARVVHAGRRRVMAELEAVLRPAPGRVEPACAQFGRCGGCQLMHLDAAAQLDFKRRLLRDALRTVAGFDPGAGVAVAAAERNLDYRNRGQYPVGRVAGRVATGFFAPRSHRLVPTERCRIHHPALDAAVAAVRAWAERKRVPIYDERRRRGWLRHVVVRRSQADGRVLVSLVAAAERGGGYGELVRLLRTRAEGVGGLVLNVNPAATNVILGQRNRCLWGRDWIEERLDGLRFRLSTGSFFQVHTAQAAVLFDRVRDFAAGASGPVVDGYCGVGVLAALLAADGREVIGIESAAAAVADARRSAERNRLALRLEPGQVERVLPGLVAAGLRPGVLLLDPPRKGCAPEVLDAAAASGCERIGYVSCHPGTLARDLARLFERGYRLERLEAVDMFPQTVHLETFAGLVLDT